VKKIIRRGETIEPSINLSNCFWSWHRSI